MLYAVGMTPTRSGHQVTKTGRLPYGQIQRKEKIGRKEERKRERKKEKKEKKRRVREESK